MGLALNNTALQLIFALPGIKNRAVDSLTGAALVGVGKLQGKISINETSI